LRTVYIFGAGFSYDANIPIQSEILEKLREHSDAISKSLEDVVTIIPIEMVNQFQMSWNIINNFLNKLFEQVRNPSLEDVFTLLDQVIQSKSFCFGVTWREIEEIKTALYKTIVIHFYICQRQISSDRRKLYQSIILSMFQYKLNQGAKDLSIISLNWDTIFEDIFLSCAEENRFNHLGINYCCPAINLESEQTQLEDLKNDFNKQNNVTVLKLHGSVNWLLCPNCNKLYTGLGLNFDQFAGFVVGRICPWCKEVFGKTQMIDEWKGPMLEPFLITPTFIKDFSNFHIQMIWNNAYRELCEAEKVVFIGYSLPEADYHLRTLLKRSIQSRTQIDIVLVRKDKIPKIAPRHIKEKYTENRYKAFFGSGSNVHFYFTGMKGYFSDILNISINDKVEQIRGMIDKMEDSTTKRRSS